MAEKKTYNIPVTWWMSAVIQVEAESLEEAVELAKDAPLPETGEFVEGSFDILEDEDNIRELYN